MTGGMCAFHFVWHLHKMSSEENAATCSLALTEESSSGLESHHQRHLMQNYVLVKLSLSVP